MRYPCFAQDTLWQPKPHILLPLLRRHKRLFRSLSTLPSTSYLSCIRGMLAVAFRDSHNAATARCPGSPHCHLHCAHLHCLLDEVAAVLCIAHVADDSRHLQPLAPQGLYCLIHILLAPAGDDDNRSIRPG